MAWFYIILVSSIVFGWVIGATIFIRRESTPKRVMIYGALVGLVVGLVWGSIYTNYHKEPVPQPVSNVSHSAQPNLKR